MIIQIITLVSTLFMSVLHVALFCFLCKSSIVSNLYTYQFNRKRNIVSVEKKQLRT